MKIVYLLPAFLLGCPAATPTSLTVPEGGPTFSGANLWSNWECGAGGGGCAASFGAAYSMACNPAAAQCNYGAQDGSWSEECFEVEGTDCDACEHAFHACIQGTL